MRIFNKSSRLNGVCYDVRGPVLDAATQMEAAGEQVIKLNIGNPAPFGFRAPDFVTEIMGSGLCDTQGYTESRGILPAREAIARYAQSVGIGGVTPDDIYTGNGVSELITLSMQALLEPGDEVLLPTPDYPLWTASVKLSSGTPVHYICDEQSDWNPDVDDIRKKITPRTKAIVVINPNNPTGAVYSKDILRQIVQLARENELMMFSDEIYDRIIMDGLVHTSLASLAPDVFTVTMGGLSKSHMIAGYRIGWMILSGPKDGACGYIEGINMLTSMRLCSNAPAQLVVEAALSDKSELYKMLLPGGRLYEQREAVCNALDRIDGITYVRPKAAFYIFPKLDIKKFNITDDVQFALDFLREQRVLIVQGTGFNWMNPDHFRIVCLPDVDALTASVNRLGEFLSNYRQQ